MSCNCCENFYKSSTVAIVGSNLVISFTNPPTGIVDTNKFCFTICQSIPTGASTLPVVLVVNGVNVPMWDKYGDIVLGGTLKTRKCYKGYYGAQGTSPHIISVNTPVVYCNCGC